MKRSGISMDIALLPGSTGIGTFCEVDKFIAFLSFSGQSFWKTSIDEKDSYFGINHLYVNSLALIGKYVDEHTVTSARHCKWFDLDYASESTERVLRSAYASFVRTDPSRDYLDFCLNNAWLNDCALFSMYKNVFDMPENVKLRNKGVLNKHIEERSDEIDYYTFCQYLLFKQWQTVKHSLNDAGVNVVFDLPTDKVNTAEEWVVGNYLSKDTSLLSMARLDDKLVKSIVRTWAERCDYLVIDGKLLGFLKSTYASVDELEKDLCGNGCKLLIKNVNRRLRKQLKRFGCFDELFVETNYANYENTMSSNAPIVLLGFAEMGNERILTNGDFSSENATTLNKLTERTGRLPNGEIL